MTTYHHEYYMELALELAARARGYAAPNPMVGCVIVNNNKIIGQGFHKQAGLGHAEVEAINNSDVNEIHNSTVYVTLEPCCHYGKTGPCTDILIKNKVKTVVIAMLDPNPLVSGKGVESLKKAGIEVILNIKQNEAEVLNKGFIYRMTKDRPYITSKIAASLDGHIGLKNGESKWITSDLSRQDVHLNRLYSDAIITTASTVLSDNPSLTVRDINKLDLLKDYTDIKQPVRVILDQNLKSDINYKIYDHNSKTILITSVKTIESKDNQDKINCFINKKIDVYSINEQNDKLDIAELWKLLAELGCNNVMVEAGGNFNGYLLQNNLVDEWLVYQSGLIMGSGSQNMFRIPPQDSMSGLIKLKCEQIKQIGDDWRLRLTRAK